MNEMKFTTMRALKEAAKEAREEARDEALQAADYWYKIPRSRGTFLSTADHGGDQCSPQAEADCCEWDGTKASIDKLVAEVLENHPHVGSIYIGGGYDVLHCITGCGSEDYLPCCSWWNVEVWKRSKPEPKPTKGIDMMLRAAREFGAEYQANPGSSRMDYLNDAASYFGEDISRFMQLDIETRKQCQKAFAAGITAEKALQ